MISLKRIDQHAIAIITDSDGIGILLQALNNASRGIVSYIEVSVCRDVFNPGKAASKETMNVAIGLGSTELKKDHGNLVWNFDHEDLETAIFQLTQASIKGYFSPSEFTYVNVNARKQPDYAFWYFPEEFNQRN